MIADGADIVVGNAEFMGMPLKDIADKYPDVYFVSIIASDLTTKAQLHPALPPAVPGAVPGRPDRRGADRDRQYRHRLGLPLRPGHPAHRPASTLGVQDAAELLGKDINVYVKYAGDWYLPQEERDIAATLVDQYNVDVLTQQTDSGSPLDVATEKGIWFVGKDMDIVGYYGWSDTDTVAVSFDTRWEVLYDQIVQDMVGRRKTQKRSCTWAWNQA